MRSVAVKSLVLLAVWGCSLASGQDCTQGCGNGAADCMMAADDCIDRRYGCGPFLPLFYESPLQSVYVTADFVGFLRDRQPYQPFASLNTPHDIVLDTDDLGDVYQPGLRLMAGRRLGANWAIEGSFLGLFQWDEAATIRDTTPNIHSTAGNLFSPISDFGRPAQVGLDFNSLAAVRLQSQFNSGELNFRQLLYTPPNASQVTALYGVRYLNVNERFTYRTQSLLPVPTGTQNTVDVSTNNNMIGLQLGAMFDLNLHPRCWINIEAKGLLLRNGAGQSTAYSVGPLDGGGATFSGERNQQRVVLGADVAVTLQWAFTPSLLGRVGYQGIFIDGLALAADNFSANAPFLTTEATQLDRDGHLTFHGPFAGLTLTW